MTRPCPNCGTARRLATLDDGRTVIGWQPCVNDYCDPPANARVESSRGVATAVVLVLTVGMAAIVVGFGVATRMQIEGYARDLCEMRGGQYAPVRDWTEWPTGRGACIERTP